MPAHIPTRLYECVRCHDTEVVIPGKWLLTGVLCADCALETANDGDGPRAAADDERLEPRQDKVTPAAAVTAGPDCDRASLLSLEGMEAGLLECGWTLDPSSTEAHRIFFRGSAKFTIDRSV